MSSLPIPIEILDLIFDKVRGKNLKRYDIDTLKACALTCRTLLRPAQQRIFSVISVTESYNCKAISLLLEEKPYIADHAHKLYIGDRSGHLILSCHGDLTSIITSIQHKVRSITLFHDRSLNFSFNDVPEDMKQALLSLFRQPNLISIKFLNIRSHPFTYLASCVQLRKLLVSCLSINHLLWSAPPYESDVLDEIEACGPKSYALKKLTLNCAYCASTVAKTRSHPLETLSIQQYHLATLLSFLSDAQDTLESLLIGLLRVYVPIGHKFNGITLRKLKHLTLVCERAQHTISSLVSLLEAITAHALETVTIHMNLSIEELSTINSNKVWDRLGNILSHDCYRHLRKLYIKMGDQESPLPFDSYAHYRFLSSRLSSLHAIGKVEYMWNGTEISYGDDGCPNIVSI